MLFLCTSLTFKGFEILISQFRLIVTPFEGVQFGATSKVTEDRDFYHNLIVTAFYLTTITNT